MTETVTISKEEYDFLKRKAAVDDELLNKIVRGLDDAKEGRIRKWTIK